MIVIADSIKGGPGKSTIAANMAVGFAQEGKDVICVDADRQLSLSKFFQSREALDRDDLARVDCVIQFDDVSRSIKQLARRCDIVIVDVAGALTQEMVTALKVADISLCPVEPSQLDIDTLPDYLAQIETARWHNPNLKDLYVLNRCAPLRTMDDAKEVAEMLKDDGLNLLNHWIYTYKPFRSLFSEGLTVAESDPESKAYKNFHEFFSEFKEHIQW